MVPVSYLSHTLAWSHGGWIRSEPYPNRMPPKATKRPMTMAGAAEPAVPLGFFSKRGMVGNDVVACYTRRETSVGHCGKQSNMYACKTQTVVARCTRKMGKEEGG